MCIRDSDHLRARSGRIWNRNPRTQHRTPPANILRQQQGVTRAGRVQNILSAFQLFVTDEILYIIVRETNRYAREYFARKANADEPSKWRDIDIIELKAAIGLLLHAGREKSGYRTLQEQWAPESSPIFRSVLSLNRMRDILRFMRFDNKITRSQRQSQDKFAAFRDVWSMFAQQLPKFYSPGSDITVDEQLVAFRGRCSFRQYLPSKPAKYVVKIFWSCDAHTSYPAKAEVYLGKQPQETSRAR